MNTVYLEHNLLTLVRRITGTNPQSKENLLPHISTHNPRNHEAFNNIHYNIPFLQNAQRMLKLFNSNKVIKSKRQPKLLKQMLTRATFQTENDQPNVQKCDRQNCEPCLYLSDGTQFFFKSGHIFKIRNSFFHITTYLNP